MLKKNDIKIDGYVLDEVETKAHEAFIQNHKGHGIIKIAKSNGIGVNVYLLCTKCKTWEDIANVDSW
jgi:hypothetical protein